MEQNTDDKDIIKKLFVSKENIAERLTSLVELSHGIINIIQESGDVYIEDASQLNNWEKIFLNLLGVYFSNKSGLRDTVSMSPTELSERLGVPLTTIPAPLSNLVNDKVVIKSDKGLYQVNFENYKGIKDTLLKIRHKINGGTN